MSLAGSFATTPLSAGAASRKRPRNDQDGHDDTLRDGSQYIYHQTPAAVSQSQAPPPSQLPRDPPGVSWMAGSPHRAGSGVGDTWQQQTQHHQPQHHSYSQSHSHSRHSSSSNGAVDFISPPPHYASNTGHTGHTGRSSTAGGVVGSDARAVPSAAASAMALSDGLGRDGHHGNDEIPVTKAASFFRTYFAVVHPQYPFLDMQLCSEYYLAWKQSLPNSGLVGWPAFFVKMIFALGSLIESKNDSSPYFKHQNLKSTAQAEQSIMTDSTSTPLVRLQAMLLSAMFALHADNTWRIVHISGVIIKFATVHRFHRLPPEAVHDPASQMAVRVWSSAYVLDRAVSSALGTPVSLPDMYITSHLYEATPEANSPVPWLADCDADSSYNGTGSGLGLASATTGNPDLRTFAHICKIRTMQSFFMHAVEKDDLHDGIPADLEGHMLQTLREWEDTSVIARHSVPNSDGYRSPVWLQHIGHLTRVSISFVNRANIHSPIADSALKAGCAACQTFRSLQKKREIAQPWLVVLSQFRAAVTVWYIVWGRAIPVPREVSDSLRDCSAVLAIFAERWPKAEAYRDCFELLSTSIPRSQPLGRLSDEARRALRVLTCTLEESGIHWITRRMLVEICDEDARTPRVAERILGT